MGANKEVTTEKAAKSLSIKRLITYWLRPVWVILALALLLSIMVLTTSHLDWVITARLLRALLPIFFIMLALMYVLWYLIPIWPLETGFITLFIMFLVFLVASANNYSLALQLRVYLSKSFDIAFFATAMTIGGLLIALGAVYEQQRKKK